MAATAFLLSGCLATSPFSPTQQVAARHLVPAFEVEGRLAASDGEQAANGRFVWRHQPGEDRWTVYSPLGQIVAQLDSDAGGARLVNADGTRVEAADAQHILPQLIGVTVPLSRLPNWVQAVPHDDITARDYDLLGRPARISDSGWLIDYSAYMGDSGDALPRRLEAYRGSSRLRLVIDQWTTLP